MSPEFIQCDFCKKKFSSGSTCELAVYHAVIDNKEYVFCCAKCAEQYQQKKKRMVISRHKVLL